MRLSNECCSKLRTLLLSFFLLTISLSAFGFNSNDDNDYVTVFNPNLSLENDKKLFLMTAIRKAALYMLDS